MPIQQPQLKAGPFATRGGPRLDPAPKSNKPPPPKPPPGLRIEHRVGIQAPAEVIWEILADLKSWHEWNALYPKAAGEIRIGAQLDITLALPGQPEQQIRPTVVDWVPNDQLHWKLTMLRGLVKTIRFFEIEELAAESCIVSNGEYVGGMLGPMLARRMTGTIYRGFRDMNEALKARAEATWAARKG